MPTYENAHNSKETNVLFFFGRGGWGVYLTAFFFANVDTCLLYIRYHYSEIFVGICIILSGFYDVLYAKKGYYIFLFIQGLAFLIVGFDYIGVCPP